MSTRCQVIIKDEHSEVWFYRHSDGYPEVTEKSLKVFLEWVESGRIRNNAEQASGWLVILGHHEYNPDMLSEPNAMDKSYGWKVGAYEPCAPEQHGDIKFLYTVDLDKLQITYKEV